MTPPLSLRGAVSSRGRRNTSETTVLEAGLDQDSSQEVSAFALAPASPLLVVTSDSPRLPVTPPSSARPASGGLVAKAPWGDPHPSTLKAFHKHVPIRAPGPHPQTRSLGPVSAVGSRGQLAPGGRWAAWSLKHLREVRDRPRGPPEGGSTSQGKECSLTLRGKRVVDIGIADDRDLEGMFWKLLYPSPAFSKPTWPMPWGARARVKPSELPFPGPPELGLFLHNICADPQGRGRGRHQNWWAGD